MGKIVLLVPREEMLCQAHNILQEKQYAISEMRVIKTEDTVAEARGAIAEGAAILIARGLQASLIKQYTDTPVVEIVVTAQEMALLIVKAKQILKKEKPVIAVVGFENMFCDMSYFDLIYNIELKAYFADGGGARSNEMNLKIKAREALDNGADLIIGGDTVVQEAKKAGIPSLFLSITEDSLRNAFSIAETMDDTMWVEKKSAARTTTILDYSFNGVIDMDDQGIITAVNPVMETILDKKSIALTGRPVRSVLPDMDSNSLKQVLDGNEESYSCFVQINAAPIFAVLAPVRVGEEIEGAVLTCHRVRKQAGEVRERDSYHGLLARGNFNQVLQHSAAMETCVHLARLYAQSEEPVLILGETGTEKRLLAESIHNTGLQREGGFAAIALGGLTGEVQQDLIFGEKGAAFLVKGGTLYLEDIEMLAPVNQYSLFQLIHYKLGNGRDFTGRVPLAVRILASSGLDTLGFQQLLLEGRFRQDLYYELQGLVLHVPPYRKRPEDLKEIIQYLVRETCEQYARYHVVTEGGMKCLVEYGWPGNAIQLESFVKRLILTAGKRSIDEIEVRRLMDELYPSCVTAAVGLGESQGQFPFRSEEETNIRTALLKYSGSREKTAESLGISKATLWRRMKKYQMYG